ncbi:hypothetical protein [Microvirga lotononidis]|uniref:Uncharacterized protein n=1 Tax=Microvirga lotononidis TaxID=864069 RepID=I4YKR6_9HYPH|nr:hypothetical protein [Microvirga lotononidis]EIM24558.1 hypothetical protein MicloDRAFT_00052720 [Microvirga lotononidis]WQO26578.1 hypothetical protein U0023_18130 [Microvirga lotononidis]
MISIKPFGLALAVLATLVASAGALEAQGFKIDEVASVTTVAPARLKPGIILFSDHRDDKLADAGTGLMRFEDWARERPLQKRLLSPYPDYVEPTITISVHGIPKAYTEKLHMYVVEARFLIDKAPDAIDLKRYTQVEVLEKIDPAIKHRRITADQAAPQADPESAYQRHPNRRWCEPEGSLCIESRYPLEGKLPVGIRLANKLEEGGKKISEFMDFQTEIRTLPPEEIERAGYAKLTGLDAPVAGVLEQTIFHVNQVMQFGKLVAVLQPYPGETGKTVVTMFMTLGVETDVLERKKEFENVPVLRNLIPAQVLMGKSSFNSGSSISAGLPDYVRNRIRAIAGQLEQ